MQARQILYIEDNHLNIRLVQRNLKTMGYKLIIAEDGDEGLAEVYRQMPDIILLDINLPKMNGVEVLKVLKSDPRTAHIPVIMLSADDASAIQRQTQALGADAFLQKPISRGKLLKTLQIFSPAFT